MKNVTTYNVNVTVAECNENTYQTTMENLNISDIVENNQASDESIDDDSNQFNKPFEPFTTTKGGRGILIDNHRYHWRRTNANNTEFWTCRVRTCPASVLTINDQAKLSTREHTCRACFTSEFAAEEAVRLIHSSFIHFLDK